MNYDYLWNEETLFCSLFYNSVQKAQWFEKLGFCWENLYLRANLMNIVPGGGDI